MGASYAAREVGTSTAEAPEGQQQQEQQEQQPVSQQMFQVCSEYRVHLFRAASTESNGVILEAVIEGVLGVLLKANYGGDTVYPEYGTWKSCIILE